MSVTQDVRIVRGACPHDCPDTCAMLVTVENGTATKVRGDPDHPFTQGGLCVKVNDYTNHTYSPDRVLHLTSHRRVATNCGSRDGHGLVAGPGAGSLTPRSRPDTAETALTRR